MLALWTSSPAEGQKGEETDDPFVSDMLSSIRTQCEKVGGHFDLTAREEQILQYLVRGWSLQLIAEEECISRNTVKTHVAHIYRKLGVRTREEMALLVERLRE